MNILIVFAASFCSVGLRCFQAINVVHNRRLLAMLTSITQSIASLTLYRIAPHVEATDTITAFIAGGVCGGQLSMYVTRKHK